jgi:salicylate hydroxylase
VRLHRWRAWPGTVLIAPNGNSRERPVVIAGAGIAGLTSAIALARTGLRPVVLERADKACELGAGLQLGPNAVRCLERLGLGPRLTRIAVTPRALEVMDAAAGRRLARMPLAEACEARYGATYLLVSRTGLHRLVTDEALNAGADIRYSSGLEACLVRGSGVIVQVAGAAPISACALIGADGLWSVARGALAGAMRPRRTPWTAWRATLASGTPALGGLPRDGARVWLAPGLHAVTYPIDAAGTCNVVVVTEHPTATEGWENLADGAPLRSVAATLAPPLSDLIGAVATWRSWPLFDSVPDRAAPAGPNGALTLVGDAAHPMLPFLAQGAGMAIEDALALAAAMAAAPREPARAFRVYENARRARVARVVGAARRNGRIFHLRPPYSTARDLVLKALSGEKMLRRQDWLYAGGPAAPAGRTQAGTV